MPSEDATLVREATQCSKVMSAVLEFPFDEHLQEGCSAFGRVSKLSAGGGARLGNAATSNAIAGTHWYTLRKDIYSKAAVAMVTHGAQLKQRNGTLTALQTDVVKF